MKGSSATANYSDGANAGITIEIADLASLSGLANLATRFDPKMEKETATGRFTLLFRKFPDGWKIVHDHTSVAG